MSKTTGYDTVAKSAGLAEGFIKSHLHPFCYYHPSKALQALRLPAEEFPRALTVVQLPNQEGQEGQMLLGQTVYVESDFTGQRSTFFTHNYVLNRPDNLAEAIGPMLYNTVFLTSSEWEELPELNELPIHEEKEVLKPGQLPFDEDRLWQLVCAVMEAVAGAKKVYVVLPDSHWVRPMIMWLYNRLPGLAADNLGFTTYSREPENKKFLHLIFMEQTDLDKFEKLERDYVLDFDSGYFSKNLPELTIETLRQKIESFAIPEPEPPETKSESKQKPPKKGALEALKRMLKR